MGHSPNMWYGFPSSRNGCIIQRVQVSYVAHVTPVPENLDSNEAASFLCAVRMSYCFVATTNIDIRMYRVSLYTAR
jgi:D-arabinose 1-dehydrogenase-like Zn-dependent alcohol dehydrogenase